MIPAAILLAGFILSIAVYVVRTGNEPLVPTGNVSLLRPVGPDDHLVGSPEAPVTIITYSDIDCAYCKQYQRTMEQLMTEYATQEKLAWVYRHLPLIDVHPDAALHAEAAECVHSIAGGESFWRFIGALQEQAPGDSMFDPSDYDLILPRVNVPEETLRACLDASRFTDRVLADGKNAVEMGAQAAPFTVVLIEGRDPLVITGTLPYPAMKTVVEDALN